MYKNRLKKWGIGKNVKSKEMAAIVRMEAQCGQEGQRPTFELRDCRVPAHKMARYRKKMRISSTEEALGLEAHMPEGLICYTPLASPLPMTRTLEIAERIARLSQDYINGSLESKSWVVTKNQECIGTIDSTDLVAKFFDGCLHAGSCWRRGEIQKARKALTAAMALLEQIVSATAPQVLRVLDHVIFNMIFLNNASGLASMLLRQFCKMSAIVLKTGHAFAQILVHLVGLKTSELIHSLGVVRQSQIDYFTSRFGRFSCRALELQRSNLKWISPHEPARAAQGYLSLLNDCEGQFGILDGRSLSMRYEVADNYLHIQQFDKTAAIVSPILVRMDRTKFPRLYGNALWMLSLAQFHLADCASAERNARGAIQAQVDTRGREDDRVLYQLTEFECWLRHYDRQNEAADLRRQYDVIVDSRDARLAREEEERYQNCRRQKSKSHR